LGNVTTTHYDANDNVVSSRVDGELTDGSSGSNVRLAESSTIYDEIGRPVQTDTAFFDVQSGAPIEDGVSTRKTYFDERSQVVHTENDEGHGPSMSYDGAGRLSTTHDAVGNTVEYGYDANGNVLTVTATDVSDNSSIPPQVTVTTNDYDELSRLLTTSRGGITHSFAWDSLQDLPVLTRDGRSNVVRRDYDGAGRLVATHREMTDTGTGSGSVAFVLDATRSHDDEGRLISQTDDNGNTTSYEYDAKGHTISTTNSDGSSESYVYNVHDDLVSWTDPNGTAVAATYDALGRVTSRSVTRAPGVLGTTSETWKYDGLSRVVYAQNNDALVTRKYDSLFHVTTETSVIGADGGRNINWIFTGGGNLLSITYPSGHNWAMAHDSSGRAESITSSGPGVCSGGPPPHAFCTTAAECVGGPCVPMSPVTTTYDYLGPDRVVRRGNGNGTSTEITYDDRRRVSSVTLRLTPLDSIDDRTFTWDDDSNKTSRMLLSSPGAGTRSTYTYDSASRMASSVLLIPGQAPVTVDYALDGANNRLSVAGGPEAGSYPMSSSLPEPADQQMNQYTSTPWDGARAYDRSGNLISRSSGASTMSYDYRGRLILVSGSFGSGSYTYDAFGRRVIVDGTRLYYDGVQEIEARSPSGALTRLMVYGVGEDESLMTVADVNGDGNPDRVFHHMDDLGNVVVVTNTAGAALERYEYGDFGRPRFLNGAGSTIPQSAIGNPFLFGGHRYDASTGLYDFRTRHLDPRAGRFVSRDTIGAWGDPDALGNATVYAGNNPWSGMDRWGWTRRPAPTSTRSSRTETFRTRTTSRTRSTRPELSR
jgi:RHS repeat-associated protein